MTVEPKLFKLLNLRLFAYIKLTLGFWRSEACWASGGSRFLGRRRERISRRLRLDRLNSMDLNRISKYRELRSVQPLISTGGIVSDIYRWIKYRNMLHVYSYQDSRTDSESRLDHAQVQRS